MAGDIQLANRVSQLESRQLDRELGDMINEVVEQLEVPSYSEELKTILKLYLLINNVTTAASPGMRVYNLAYRDVMDCNQAVSYVTPPKRKLALLAAINLVGSYLSRRLGMFEKLLSGTRLAKINFPWLSLDNAVLTIKSFGIINFLVFLKSGAYLSIPERILGIAPALSIEDYDKNVYLNRVQMEFMYREMIWRALAEFLSTVVPLINAEWIKNSLARLTGVMPRLQSELSISEKMTTESNSKKCAICLKQPFNPYVIGCRHVFCHYCLQSRYLSDPSNGYVCLTCEYKTHDLDNLRRHKVMGALQ